MVSLKKIDGPLSGMAVVLDGERKRWRQSGGFRMKNEVRGCRESKRQ